MMVSDFDNFMMLIFKLQGNQASSADKIAISRLSPSRLAFKGDNYEAAVLTDSTALVFTALARFLLNYLRWPECIYLSDRSLFKTRF